jgi:hypothetical protein
MIAGMHKSETEMPSGNRHPGFSGIPYKRHKLKMR